MPLLIQFSLWFLLLLPTGLRPSVAPEPVSVAKNNQAKDWPVPTGIKNLLFYIQRDPNINTAIYELNVDDRGVLNEQEPIKVYWIRYADKGQRQELNYFQRKLAYGLEFKKLGPDKFEFRFVCHTKLPFYLVKAADGKFVVHKSISGKEALLKRIYVRIEGGTFWVPNVRYADIEGMEIATGKPIAERYLP